MLRWRKLINFWCLGSFQAHSSRFCISSRFFPFRTSIFEFYHFLAFRVFTFLSLFSPSLAFCPLQRQTNGFNYSFGKRERNVVDSFFSFAIFQNSTKSESGKNCCRHVFTIVPIFVASSSHPQKTAQSLHSSTILLQHERKMRMKYKSIFRYKAIQKKSISANLLWFMIMISHY